MNTIIKFSFILFFLSLSFQSFGQENKKITTVNLTNSLTEIIFTEPEYVSSVVISSGNDGVLMIDNGSKESYQDLIATIKTICDKELKYIILTHWHFDHTNGDSLNANDVSLISHPYTRQLLSEDQTLLGMPIKAHTNNILPQITIDSKTTIYFNDDTVEIIPLTGGHTGGDLIVYFKNSKVLHIGDLIFSDVFAFYDIDHRGNVFKAIENIQKIIDIMPADTRIIPSHGREISIADLKDYKNMIIETSNLVKKEIEKGKSLETLKKENVLKNYSDWAKGFTCEDWIDFVYKSLSK
ncbi:MAG: MBL fold metallo-hydrolase [Bacteroidota bacterium]